MNKEYIERLKAMRDIEGYIRMKRKNYNDPTIYLDEAIGLLLDVPTADVASRELFEQIKWERDIAMAQLKEHGIAFGAKKTADVVEVVRCKDCVNYCGFERCKNGICDVDPVSKRAVQPYDFCSYGERKEQE